jgi:integrase
LPIGTYGDINITGPEPRTNGRPAYRARARFRDPDGVTRPVVRYGQTKGRAEAALKTALVERHRDAERSMVGADTKVADLATMFLADVTRTKSTNTIARYSLVVQNQIMPLLGGVRVRELRRPVINAALTRVRQESGHGAAASMKTVLSGICKLAMAHDAMDANPVRDSISVAKSSRDEEPVRALTVAETETLTDALRTDPRAVEFDLPDLVEFMLGTGARIGEACACRDATLAEVAGVHAWDIDATVVRVPGVGLRIQPPKTRKSRRVVPLPSYTVDIIERRKTELRFGRVEGVVFGSPRAKALRDPSNTAGDMRSVFDRICCPHCEGYGWHSALKTDKQNAGRPSTVEDEFGHVWWEECGGAPPFAWLHSHVFRKTVATRLDDGGMSAPQIATILGHADASMTLRVYIARSRDLLAEAATILNR